MHATLVVYDLDETLISSSPQRDRPGGAFYPVLGYNVCPRPHLGEHLRAMAEHFTLAVWSAASPDYVRFIVETFVRPHVPNLLFVWDRDRCVLRRNFELDLWSRTKPLKKVRRAFRKHFDLHRMIIVENDPNQVRDYGNVIYVQDFEGANDDTELHDLTRYLPTLKDAPSVRAIDKRGWRKRIEPILAPAETIPAPAPSKG